MKLFEKLKEWAINMLSKKTVEEKLNISTAISDKMTNSINNWYLMYQDRQHRDEQGNLIHSLNLAYTIADEKSRTATLELISEILPKGTGEIEENSRVFYLNEQYQELIKMIRFKLTPAIALGTMVIKPILNIETNTISYNFVLANEFFPMAFNEKGKLIHAVFVEQIQKQNVIYTRLETHKLAKGTITITNQAYKSNGNTDIGEPITLKNIAEWQSLEEKVTIKSANSIQLDRLLVATFIMPNANNIDIHSKMGISGYANAEKLINNANDLYSSLLWEMRAGEMAINTGKNAVRAKRDEKGNIINELPKKEQRLFREVYVTNTTGNDLYDVYAPQLRDSNYLNVLNSVLMTIEDTVGISRGVLSKVDDVAKTATEIKSAKQKTYQTNKSIQESLETTLKDIIYILDVYATLYNIVPQQEIESTFKWDDSILIDIGEELRQRNSLISLGVLKPEEVASWYLEIPLEKRMQEIQEYNKLKEKYDPVIQENDTTF